MMSISRSSDPPSDSSSGTDAGRSAQPTPAIQLAQCHSATEPAAAPATLLAGNSGSPTRLGSGRSFLSHRRQLARRISADPRPAHPSAPRGPFQSSQSSRPSATPSPHNYPRQRHAGDRAPPPSPAAPPPLLRLSTSGGDTIDREVPCSAPIPRLARSASRRGISIDIPLSRAQKLQPQVASAGLPTRIDALSTSPSDNLLSVPPFPTSAYSTKSPTSTPMPSPNFRRGLTVAILTDDGEIVAESAPVTSRVIPDGRESPSSQMTNYLDRKTHRPTSMPGSPRQREIILCRYYHTQGLTCTSSPCRFVHSLEGLSLRGSSKKPDSSHQDVVERSSPVAPDQSNRQQSPTFPSSPLKLVSNSGRLSATPATTDSSPDPTRGTFARAQATTPMTELRLDGDALATIQSGDPITLKDAHGKEISGHVFKLSGGGKGAGGKSRTKYKSEFSPGRSRRSWWCGSPMWRSTATTAASAAQMSTF